MNKNFLISISIILVLVTSCSSNVDKEDYRKACVEGVVTYTNASNNSNIVVMLDSEDESLRTTCKKDGSYRFKNLDEGEYCLYVISSNSLEKTIFTNLTVTENEVTSVPDIFLTATGTISGKISLDQSEKDNAGFTVFIGGTSYMAITGSDGLFTISGVPANTQYQLIVMYGTYIQIWKSDFIVTEFMNLDVGELELSSDVITSGSQGVSAKTLINYELNGGTLPQNAPELHDYGEITVLPVPSRLGYEFNGFYYEEDFSGCIVETLDEKYPVGKILYAKWIPKEYSILYQGVEGLDNPNEIIKYTIESPDIMLKDISKKGYKFLGWINGSDIIEKIPSGSIGNITLTAKWEVIKYSIFYENTHKINNENPQEYTVEDLIVLKPLCKEGYIFKGWQDKDGKEIETIPKGSVDKIVLYANIILEEYSITYNGLGETDNPNEIIKYTIESPDIMLKDVLKKGYLFLGWSNGSCIVNTIPSGSTGNLSLTAVWQIEKYQIKFLNTLGTFNPNPEDYTIEDGFELQPIESIGCVFLGWKDEKGNFVTEIETGTCGSLTLIADWEYIEYSISYNCPEGTDNHRNPLKYTVQDDVYIYEGECNNLKFTWFFTDPERPCTGWQKGKRIGDVVLNANTYINVKYKIEGEDGYYKEEMYSCLEDVKLFQPKSDKVSFSGWYTSQDYSGNSITGWNAYEKGGYITLYGKWNWEEWSVIRQIKTMTEPGKVEISDTIGKSELKEIKEVLINDCNVLITLDFSKAKDLSQIGNLEDSYTDGAFANCSKLEGIILPDTVKLIGGGAFAGCKRLKRIEIPDSVEEMGMWCFYECEELEEVIMGDGIITIPDGDLVSPYAVRGFFSCCDNLKKVRLSRNLKTLGAFTFSWCQSLKTITIPDTVEYIKCCEYVVLEDYYNPYSQVYVKRNAIWCEYLENVVFENPKGWYVTEGEIGESPEILLSEEDLADPLKAAELVNITYQGYSWFRKSE